MKLASLTICFAISSCAVNPNKIKWNPDFYLHNVKNGHAINEKNHKIPFSSSEFQDYVSIHMNEIIELNEILEKAEIPDNKRNLSGLKKNRNALKRNLENTINNYKKLKN